MHARVIQVWNQSYDLALKVARVDLVHRRKWPFRLAA